MNNAHQSEAGKAVTDLVLDLFRVNSRMITAGDRLVSDLGLTSARWQILGSIIAADRAQPVAWLARDMGTSRQNLQRIINDLARDGLVVLKPNPHHRRAPLVELTAQGRKTFDAAMAVQAIWADDLAQGFSVDDLLTARKVLIALRQQLEDAD